MKRKGLLMSSWGLVCRGGCQVKRDHMGPFLGRAEIGAGAGEGEVRGGRQKRPEGV